MIRSPLDVILEIVVFLITSSVNTLMTLFKLLGDLFRSLVWTSQAGIIGLITAIIIGGLFVVFMAKYFFKTTFSMLKLIAIYGVFVVAVIIILYIFSLIT